MARDRSLTNEIKYPHIIELWVNAHELDFELSRRIMKFHRARHIQVRHGRKIVRENKIYFRWCFSDLPTAHGFMERFEGSFATTL